MRWLAVAFVAGFLYAPTSARPVRHPSIPGLRIFENGKYRWIPRAELARMEQAVKAGHQPWRRDPLEVARVGTLHLLPGRPSDWEERVGCLSPDIAALEPGPFTTGWGPDAQIAIWAVRGKPAGRRKVIVEADLPNDLTSDVVPRYLVEIRRPVGSVWWMTRVWKLRPPQ